MRVSIDELRLEEGAENWWRKLSPSKRAILIQSLWECGHGAQESENPHEEAIQERNGRKPDKEH